MNFHFQPPSRHGGQDERRPISRFRGYGLIEHAEWDADSGEISYGIDIVDSEWMEKAGDKDARLTLVDEGKRLAA